MASDLARRCAGTLAVCADAELRTNRRATSSVASKVPARPNVRQPFFVQCLSDEGTARATAFLDGSRRRSNKCCYPTGKTVQANGQRESCQSHRPHSPQGVPEDDFQPTMAKDCYRCQSVFSVAESVRKKSCAADSRF